MCPQLQVQRAGLEASQMRKVLKEIMQSVRAKQSIMRRVNINQCDDQGTIPVTMQMNQSVILPFTAGL